jgi:hypothetical protein
MHTHSQEHGEATHKGRTLATTHAVTTEKPTQHFYQTQESSFRHRFGLVGESTTRSRQQFCRAIDLTSPNTTQRIVHIKRIGTRL